MIPLRSHDGKTYNIVGSLASLTCCNLTQTSLPKGELIFKFGQTYHKPACGLDYHRVNIPSISLSTPLLYYIYASQHILAGIYESSARAPPYENLTHIFY
jgi:hypothetical protein